MSWEPDYTTVEDYKVWVASGYKEGDTADDVAIGLAITAASRAIDRYVSQRVPRQFGSLDAPAARYYTPRWDDCQARWVIEIDDLDEAFADSLTVTVDLTNQDDYSLALTKYVLRDKNAPSMNRPYTQISVLANEPNQPTYFKDSVKAVARWGWVAFPGTVVEATQLQVNRLFERRQAPFGVSGSYSIGSAASGDTTKTWTELDRLDKDIENMLEVYVKAGWTM